MNLWSTFPPISPTEWKDKIIQDLKGKPFSDIIWKTSYGELDPTEIPNHTISTSFNKTNEFCWELIDSQNINSNLLNILKNGANSVSLKNISFKHAIFNNVMNDIIYTHVNIVNLSFDEQNKWVEWIHSNNFNGSIRYGLQPESFIRKDDDSTLDLIKNIQSTILNHRMNCLHVDGNFFSKRIYDIDYELAYSLAYLNECIESYKSHGISIPTKFIFSIDLGTSLFEEISKIKSIKILVQKLMQVHNISAEIDIETSFNNINISPTEKEHNILRLTTSCLASMIGGAKRWIMNDEDAVFNGDYWKKISCNIPIILKEESSVLNNVDVTIGNHVINNITNKLCNSAWQHFKHIEKDGGFKNSCSNGKFQSIVEKYQVERINQLKNNNSTYIGFNVYTKDKPSLHFDKKLNNPIKLKDLI